MGIFLRVSENLVSSSDNEVIAERKGPRLLPFFLVVGCVLFLLKAMNIWVGVSSVSAGQFFGRHISNITDTDDNSNESTSLKKDTVDNSEAEPSDNADELLIARPSHTQGRDTKILERLGKRRRELDEREAAIDVREGLLQAAERHLEEKLEQLEDKRQALIALEKKRALAKTERVEGLVKAYERMKPRDAAPIFELLEEDLLVLVAGQMRNQALSGILSHMSPDRAKTLTELISKDDLTEDYGDD